MSFNSVDRPKNIIDWYDSLKPLQNDDLKRKYKLNIFHAVVSLLIILIIFSIFIFYKQNLEEKQRALMPEVVYITENELDGIWDTSYGVLDFKKISENSFYGKYLLGQGKIYGKLTDKTLLGYYTENEDSQKCNEEKYKSFHWGTFEFIFNDDLTEFEGRWAVCSLTREEKWVGKKMR